MMMGAPSFAAVMASRRFSTSTSIFLCFLFAYRTNFNNESATSIWLSFIITILSKDMRCLWPPPISTASLSKIRRPGTVFLVEYNANLGFTLRINLARKLGCVVMTHLLDQRFITTLSNVYIYIDTQLARRY